MFKNLTLYRLGADGVPSFERLDDALGRARFVACGATQPSSAGFVPPRGAEHGPLVESVGGQWLMRLMIEKKVLPGSVIRRRADEMAAEIEKQTGRKPGRKQSRELKEDALHELLPLAFTQRSTLGTWLDPEAGLLAVDSGSTGRADEVATLLSKALDGLPVGYVETALSPAAAMAGWLGEGEAPPGFTIDQDCELRAGDESKAAVRYARHPLDIDEVRRHVAAGKRPTRLALTWAGRVSFVLADTLQLRRIGFVDGVLDDAAGGDRNGGDDAFDADAALFTGELRRLLPDLIDALGGERPRVGEAVPAPAQAAETAPAEAEAETQAPW